MLDTNVVVVGLRSRNGASAVVLELVAHKHLAVMVSEPLLDEYVEVLRRPVQKAAHGLTDEEIDRFVGSFIGHADLVPARLGERLVMLRDPDDAIVAEAAIDGAADHLVTHNLRHFAEIRRVVSVLTPGALLRRIAEEEPT